MNSTDVEYLVTKVVEMSAEIKAMRQKIDMMESKPLFEWITRRQAASLLGVSLSTIDKRKDLERNGRGEIRYGSW